jgi:hypothetical protein
MATPFPDRVAGADKCITFSHAPGHRHSTSQNPNHGPATFQAQRPESWLGKLSILGGLAGREGLCFAG